MVPVWGVLQFVLSKLTDAGETVPSVRSFDDNATLTVLPPPGLLSSTTVKVVDPPASVVTRPDVGVTVMPAGASDSGHSSRSLVEKGLTARPSAGPSSAASRTQSPPRPVMLVEAKARAPVIS